VSTTIIKTFYSSVYPLCLGFAKTALLLNNQCKTSMPEFIANKFCGNTDEMLLKTLLINSQTRTFSGKLALEIVRFR